MKIRKALKLTLALILALAAGVMPASSRGGDPGRADSAAEPASARALELAPLDWGPVASRPISIFLAAARSLITRPLDWGTEPEGPAASAPAPERPCYAPPLDWGREPSGPGGFAPASERSLSTVSLDWGPEPEGSAGSSPLLEWPPNAPPLDWGPEPGMNAASSSVSERPLDAPPPNEEQVPAGSAESSSSSSLAAPNQTLISELRTSEVFFEPSETRLGPQAMEPLAVVVFTLRAHPGSKARIEAGANPALSRRRAASVKSFFTANGIAARRLSVASGPARGEDRKVVVSVYE